MPAAEKRKPRNAPLLHNWQPKKLKAISHAQMATQTSPQNLTLSDWLMVFAYVDAHPSIPQKDIVKHFGTLKTGALNFTQSTLSHKLKNHSEAKGEQFNGQMLKEKHSKFQELFNVPNVERLLGDGWITSFCRTEQARVRGILSKFAPHNQWNFDETSLFPFAPSDCEKFRIMLGIACNADGSEKFDLISLESPGIPNVF
ncbi:hypothetical protein L210DRAFT_960474 [Boletus edulis BED1]|uniref:Uncharacterized protein n=1 Tax=Boletus edulis BED1 TaxID=1328754 RepID=A0AAD4BJX1_BOLED|nr:hypothetical protein L210DRAFT_960474 [Boletus edulis BED1]